MVEITKVAQASYVALEFEQSPQPGLEMAASLAELISLRMAQLKSYGKTFGADFLQKAPDYGWLDWSGPVVSWQEVGIRALLSAYRYYLGASLVQVLGKENEAQLVPVDPRGKITPAVENSLRAIALWADVELGPFDELAGTLTIHSRK